MKITLEFENQIELNTYIEDKLNEKNTINISEGVSFIPSSVNRIKIPDYSRRRYFSAYELDFIKSNYTNKKIIWIAKALRRKPQAIYSIMYKMYKEGLPRKNKIINH